MKKGYRPGIASPFVQLADRSIAVVVEKNKDRMYLLAAGNAYARMQEFFRPDDAPKTAPKTATAMVIGQHASGGYSVLVVDRDEVSPPGGLPPEVELVYVPFTDLEPAGFRSGLAALADTVFVGMVRIPGQITGVRQFPDDNHIEYGLSTPFGISLVGMPVLSDKNDVLGLITSGAGTDFASFKPIGPNFVLRLIKSFEKYLANNKIDIQVLRESPPAYDKMRIFTRIRQIDFGLRGLHNRGNGGIVITGLPNAVSPEGLLTELTYRPGETLIKTWIDSSRELRSDFQRYRSRGVGVITRATFTNIVTSELETIRFGEANFRYVLTMISQFADLEKEVLMTVAWTLNSGDVQDTQTTTQPSKTKVYTLQSVKVAEIFNGISVSRQNYEKSDFVRISSGPRINSATNYIDALPEGMAITNTDRFLDYHIEQ